MHKQNKTFLIPSQAVHIAFFYCFFLRSAALLLIELLPQRVKVKSVVRNLEPCCLLTQEETSCAQRDSQIGMTCFFQFWSNVPCDRSVLESLGNYYFFYNPSISANDLESLLLSPHQIEENKQGYCRGLVHFFLCAFECTGEGNWFFFFKQRQRRAHWIWVSFVFVKSRPPHRGEIFCNVSKSEASKQ